MKKKLAILFFLFLSFNLFAQEQDSIPKSEYLDAIVTDEDTIYINYLDEITLFDYLPLSPNDQRKYYRLRKKVLKVYPYALEASNQYLEVNESISSLKRKRKQRKYSKSKMKWIKNNFSDELKKLKRSEGRILVKLLHRNLQITAYDLVKEYKSGFSARMWQTFAGLYDIDLKSKYKPEDNEDDRLIEMIIQKAIMDDLIEESKLSPYEVVKISK